MHTAALESASWGEVGWVAGAIAVSVVLHLGLAAGVSQVPERVPDEPVWIEMAVAEVQPAPEPPPPPEPEPEPQKPPPPEPEKVEFQPPPPEPQPVAPDPKPVPKVIQGLSNESFLPGQGTGFDARAGTTTATRATSETMDLGEANEFVTVPYAAVTNPPKVKFKPTLEVPATVKEAGLQGRVELLLTIDANGLVADVTVAQSLSPDADAACVAAMKKSRWKPGDKDGVPVVTLKVPWSCRFEQTQ